MLCLTISQGGEREISVVVQLLLHKKVKTMAGGMQLCYLGNLVPYLITGKVQISVYRFFISCVSVPLYVPVQSLYLLYLSTSSSWSSGGHINVVGSYPKEKLSIRISAQVLSRGSPLCQYRCSVDLVERDNLGLPRKGKSISDRGI